MRKQKQAKLLVCKVNIIQRMRYRRRTQVTQLYILLTISRKQSDQSVQDYFLGEGGGVVKEDILTENAQLKCEMKLPIGIAKFSQQTHEMSFFLGVSSTLYLFPYYDVLSSWGILTQPPSNCRWIPTFTLGSSHLASNWLCKSSELKMLPLPCHM